MVVTFLRYPPNLRGLAPAAEAFGSGFLLNVQDDLILVTAEHVARMASNTDTILKTQCETAMLSGSGTWFCCDAKADIAVARVTKLFSAEYKYDISSAITAQKHFPDIETSIALFMGTPNTKNKVNHNHGVYDFELLSISLTERRAPRVCSKISNPYYFSFTRRKMVPGINRPEAGRVAPDPHGMSGGPVLRIWMNLINNTLSASLLGVACECNSDEGVLVAAHHSDIWPLVGSLHSAADPATRITRDVGGG